MSKITCVSGQSREGLPQDSSMRERERDPAKLLREPVLEPFVNYGFRMSGVVKHLLRILASKCILLAEARSAFWFLMLCLAATISLSCCAVSFLLPWLSSDHCCLCRPVVVVSLLLCSCCYDLVVSLANSSSVLSLISLRQTIAVTSNILRRLLLC